MNHRRYESSAKRASEIGVVPGMAIHMELMECVHSFQDQGINVAALLVKHKELLALGRVESKDAPTMAPNEVAMAKLVGDDVDALSSTSVFTVDGPYSIGKRKARSLTFLAGQFLDKLVAVLHQ
jgi:hypothetical protein